MSDFSKDVVIITGAAGNLGQAVTKQFLEKGAVVCGLDHQTGRTAHWVPAEYTGKFIACDGVDVTDRDRMLTLPPGVHAKAGKATILVNALGGYLAGETVFELSSRTWERMLALNVTSFLNLSAAFLPDLLENRRGKLIAVSAKAGLQGGAKSGAYAASKAALLRLVESQAAEVGPMNIQVNAVVPGVLDTPQNRAAMPSADISKWVSVDELARVILFLCSPEADRINGAALPVYG